MNRLRWVVGDEQRNFKPDGRGVKARIGFGEPTAVIVDPNADGASDRALLIIRSRSSPMPSTSRAMTSNPPSAGGKLARTRGASRVGPSTTRYRKPFGARPSGSTVTTPTRPRAVSISAVPPWTDKGGVANPCDDALVSDAKQLAVNATAPRAPARSRSYSRGCAESTAIQAKIGKTNALG